jgi:hypothetical protein
MTEAQIKEREVQHIYLSGCSVGAATSSGSAYIDPPKAECLPNNTGKVKLSLCLIG